MPTRIYVPACLAAIAAGGVKALAHITGGGLIENLPRVLPEGFVASIDAGAWALPPVFGWLGTAGRVDRVELARTFNCGVGMVLVVGADDAARLAGVLGEAGETVLTLGSVVRAGGRARVELRNLEAAWPNGASPS